MNKRLYFYYHAFQVKTNFRNAITIPERSWSRFRDILDEYVDKMKTANEESEGTNNAAK